MLRIAVAAAVAAGGCLAVDVVECADGIACPLGKQCDDVHHGCVDPDQNAVCDGHADNENCATDTVTGGCFDGVCLPRGCGNGVLEPNEVCDDGNGVAGDNCPVDCGACFADDFDDNAIDSSKWGLLTDNIPPAMLAEVNQQLEITLAPQSTGYNGLVSAPRDLTGSTLTIELVESVSQGGGVECAVELRLTDTERYVITTGGTSLVPETKSGGMVLRPDPVPTYNAVAHRWWRIQHDATANMMRFATSPDGLVFTELLVTPALVDLRQLEIRLLAGSFLGINSNPGAARFDNVTVTSATCP